MDMNNVPGNKTSASHASCDADPSPFHQGEQAIQTRLGVRDRMEGFGRKYIRDFMPDQHRKFYEKLPYVFLGHIDAEGRPWASVLSGQPGFMQSPDPRHLTIKHRPLVGDPLSNGLRTGAAVGIVGVELHTRRRNRVSGRIESTSPEEINLRIDQSFGNCPKYIQARELTDHKEMNVDSQQVDVIHEFDDPAINLISGSDTFFVSSYHRDGSGLPVEGVDISHRGGMPGFIRVDNRRRITVPDYRGNFHFNTLGNFLENSRGGLLFIDWEYGDLLMLTGTVEILWDSPEIKHFEGAERLWTFRLEKGVRLNNALPLKWKFSSYSKHLPE